MTCRQSQSEKAEAELQAAKTRLVAAKTNRQRRDADEDVEFWGNKAAFFGCVKMGSFSDDAI